MIDCYKTDTESLRGALERADKYKERYDNLINKIDKEIKRHRMLTEVIESEDYSLAHSMTADFLEELKEVQNGK